MTANGGDSMDAVLFVLVWRRNQGASGFAPLGLHNDAFAFSPDYLRRRPAKANDQR
jgi:hypothetical protein